MRILRNNSKLSILMCSLCIFSILVGFPAAIAPRGTGERILTNFALLERISSEAIDELLANMPAIPGGESILIKKARGIGEVDFVFENVLLKKMREARFNVSVDTREESKAHADSIPEYRLSYQIIRMSLAYPKIDRRYWLGAKEVERAAEIGIFAQLTDLTKGDIIWIGDTQKRYEDVIAYSLLPKVEEEQYEFTRPARKELRWSKLVEPVIVTGIVTGLVYLFFSNQSDE